MSLSENNYKKATELHRFAKYSQNGRPNGQRHPENRIEADVGIDRALIRLLILNPPPIHDETIFIFAGAEHQADSPFPILDPYQRGGFSGCQPLKSAPRKARAHV
jgi:hypothetical protein